MGQTKKIRKKYKTPFHPWQRERILEEKDILRDYGLKNKKEIWKYTSKLRFVRNQIKKIIAQSKSEQAQKEKKLILDRLVKYNIIEKNTKIEDILELAPKDFFERRLQTFVYRKGLARSIKQARQFIVHGHILVNNQKVTSPSYFVSKNDETKIEFRPTSKISRIDHAERNVLEKKEKGKKEQIEEELKLDEKEQHIPVKINKEKIEKIAEKEAEKMEEEARTLEAVSDG